MGRKTSPLEDLMVLVSELPWYVCLLLAAASYLLVPSIWGKFVFPLILTICALLSFVRSFQRDELYSKVQNSSANEILQDMTWGQFEILVGEAFRRKGFRVRENFDTGPDGGVDLVLSDGANKYLVQCKRWKAFKVGVSVVRELFGVMAATGAVGGYVVTSGHFTSEAQIFAQGKNIKLIDGSELWSMIQVVKASPLGTTEPTVSANKLCPKCGKEMVLRTARRGPKAGQKFWGCTGYPGCKYTLSFEQ